MRAATTLLTLALVLGVAAGGAWLALRDGGPGGASATGEGPTGTPEASDESAPAAKTGREARARAKGPGAWTKQGEGSVLGVVREHGTDRGLAGVPVELTAGADGPDATLRGTTSADGAFRFEKVAGFGGWTFRARVAEPKVDVELRGVSVAADRTTDLGTVWAVAPQALGGIVVDAKGAAVEGAEIRVLRPFRLDRMKSMTDAISAMFGDPVPVDTARTDPDGRFRLLRTPPGSFDLTADKDGFARGVEKVSLVPGAAAPEVRFRLDAGHAVTGVVKRRGAKSDAAGGAPATADDAAAGAEGVLVRATPHEGFGMTPWLAFTRVAVATTDAAGAFRIGGLAAGKWSLSASVTGELSSDDVEVQVPRSEPVELTIGGDAWIAGRVTGPGGAAIAGARVLVNPEGRRFVPPSVLTDADGAYRVGGFAAGSDVHVFAEARGYRSSLDLAAMMKDDRLGRVTLTAGANTFDIVLVAGGKLRGRVSEKGGERPLDGVRVTVRESGPAGIMGGNEAFTAADGTFEIRGLPKGKLSIHLEKTGWHPVGKAAAANPLAELLEGRNRDDEPAGEDPGTGYEIVASDGTTVERSLEMERAAVVTGRVVDPAGAGISGARVRVKLEASGRGGFDPAEMLAKMFGGGDDDVKVTDATGAFELTAPPDASFRVTAEAQGFVDGKSAAMTGAAGARVECEPISLSRGATVEGIVTTPEGGPAEGVEISWKREADPDDPMSFLAGFMGERGGKEPAAATTGADGAFRMHGVPPGKVTVTFKAAGFRPLTRPQVATKDGETARLDVTLDRGAVVTGRVVDETGAGVAGARVSCSLKQAPLLGEEDDTKTFGSTESQDEGGTAESGADGSFRIEGVAPGEHVVRAGAKGLHLAKPVEANADGDPVTVRMLRGLAISGIVRCDGKPAQGVRVSASPQGGAADNGTGFEEFDPEEMDVDAGAIDVLFPGTRIATTRADGTFEIENLAPGKYTVTAKPRPAHLRAIGVGGSEAAREEGERAAHPTEIVRTAVKDVAAGSHDLVIDCAPGLAIAGSVLLADGSTPKDGTVSVERAGVVEMPPDDEGEDGADDFDEEDWDLSNIDLGDDGTFRVAGLGAGQYVVTVEVPGAGRVRTVAEAGKTDLKLRLRPAGAVTGRIVLPGGRSAGKVWFELRRDGAKPGEPEESDFNVTDRAGKFDLKGVAEGPWTIAVEDHGAGGRRWIGTATLTVRAGETTKVPDLVLRDAGPAEDDEEDE